MQLVLSNRSKPKKQDWIHAYKGLIKCANCGCAITAETKVKHYERTKRDASYTYYRCTRRKGPCDQPAITEQELEEMIYKNISQISIDKEVWDLGIKLLKAKNASEFEQHHKMKFQFEIELSKVDKSLEKLLELRLSEEITAEEYAGQKKVLIDKKLDLKEKIEDRDQSSSNWLELAENFFETAYRAKEIINSDDVEAKRELVRAVGGSNLFLKDKKLQFTFKKPYDVLLQPEVRSNVQGCSDSN